MQEPSEFQLTPAQRKRLITVAIIVVIGFVLFSFGGSALRLLADYWWYSEDAGATVVFLTPLKTRLLLFAIALVVATLSLLLNARAALNAPMVISEVVPPQGNDVLGRLLSLGQKGAARVINIGTPIVAFFMALSFSANWESYLRYSNSVQFERMDPIFGLDYSFFVFRLPFLQSMVSWLLFVVFVTIIVTAAVYFLLRGLAMVARAPLQVPAIQKHLGFLVGVGMLLLAIVLWLERYEAGSVVGARFTGAGYSAMWALGAQALVCYVLALAGIAAVVGSLRGRSVPTLIFGSIATALVYLVGVAIGPGIVQQYWVKPNELEYETPFIARALDATRWAYGIEAMDRRSKFPAKVRPTAEEISEAQPTLQNMRLWDPYVLQKSVQELQGLRDYYVFQDIDVDRYSINGSQRMLMIGARDLILEAGDQGRLNWQNRRLLYTHGNGVVAVPVNEATTTGRPIYFLSDVPPQGRPELSVTEPRIYYADTRDQFGSPIDRYLLLKIQRSEFDFETDEESAQGHTWTHDGGVNVGSGFRKFVYWSYFGEKDILFSDQLTDDSRIVYRRTILERSRAIFPWLKWDSDPYITIVNGRLTWILDGYSVSSSIPYSDMSGTTAQGLNYIRNSVKMTIDAYTGEWVAYRMDDDEPILKAYEKIYPGLLSPLSDAPEEVVAHFRYPEDMFTLQARQLAQYHVTDEVMFFQKDDAWEIPQSTGSDGKAASLDPYYVQMRLPDEDKDAFVLILPFSPIGRPNMIGWLAAHCDPADYGRVVLYEFPRGTSINGPAQQEAQFDQDRDLAEKTTLLDQVGSSLTPGNLLVIPIGESVMYVKTLFLESERSGIRPIPELKLVVLAFSDKVVFAESYSRARTLLFGTSDTTPPPDPGTGDPDITTPPIEGQFGGEAARRALDLLLEGEEALRDGDWAAYGEAQRKLRDLLEEATSGGVEEPSSEG